MRAGRGLRPPVHRPGSVGLSHQRPAGGAAAPDQRAARIRDHRGEGIRPLRV